MYRSGFFLGGGEGGETLGMAAPLSRKASLQNRIMQSSFCEWTLS